MVRKIINIITTVILILMIALVVFIFISRANGHTPAIFGNRIYRVQTDSMVPTLNVGDVILVHDADPEDIHLGDIITYRKLSGSLAGQTITHRVAQEPEMRNGVWYYRTKGDREGAPLDDEITYSQVEGKYVSTLAFLNDIYSFFLSPKGLIIFIGIIIVLFGYEMISLIVSYKAIDGLEDELDTPKDGKANKKASKAKNNRKSKEKSESNSKRKEKSNSKRKMKANT